MESYCRSFRGMIKSNQVKLADNSMKEENGADKSQQNFILLFYPNLPLWRRQ